jgi:Mrp family chromosome partitioning ATPase
VSDARLSAVPIGPDLEDAETYEEASAPPLVAVARPRALPFERFRMIALRLDRMLGERASKVLVVTSPQRGDGKTTTAIGLAASLARDLGRRTMLVDCDLARPRLAAALGLTVQRGAGDVLRGAARLEDVIWRIGDDPLYVVPGSPDPADAVAPVGGLAHLVNAARGRAEWVVLDCPAALESADASALGRFADGVALVVRSGSTRREAVAAALEVLCDSPLLGCVMNEHDGHAVTPPPPRPALGPAR